MARPLYALCAPLASRRRWKSFWVVLGVDRASSERSACRGIRERKKHGEPVQNVLAWYVAAQRHWQSQVDAVAGEIKQRFGPDSAEG